MSNIILDIEEHQLGVFHAFTIFHNEMENIDASWEEAMDDDEFEKAWNDIFEKYGTHAYQLEREQMKRFVKAWIHGTREEIQASNELLISYFNKLSEAQPDSSFICSMHMCNIDAETYWDYRDMLEEYEDMLEEEINNIRDGYDIIDMIDHEQFYRSREDYDAYVDGMLAGGSIILLVESGIEIQGVVRELTSDRIDGTQTRLRWLLMNGGEEAFVAKLAGNKSKSYTVEHVRKMLDIWYVSTENKYGNKRGDLTADPFVWLTYHETPFISGVMIRRDNGYNDYGRIIMLHDDGDVEHGFEPNL